MALVSSGQLSIADIAANQGTSSIGVVQPYSLRQLAILGDRYNNYNGTGVTDSKVSNFYGYPGYGYKLGSPAILHDFGLSSRYSTGASSIIDTSGNGRTGTFVSGTGNGTATNISGYNTTFPGNINASNSSQYAVRLDDTAKFGGTASFTWSSWFKVSSFGSSYCGIISCEGRSGSAPIGQSLYISNASGYYIVYERWNGTSGSANAMTINFGSGVVPAFEFNKWYFITVTFNGSSANMYLHIANHAYYYQNNMSVSTSVTTSGSWGCFQGLRYNNWLTGSFGYTAIYSSALAYSDVFDIYTKTKPRY